MIDFTHRLHQIQLAKHSRLCIGLDPDPQRLPAHLLKTRSFADAVLAFNEAIIATTASAACALKLNFAFYEALGPDTWRVLDATIRKIPDDVLIIADAKRGDIGNSARFYAEAVFDRLGCDAITVAPFMGWDSIEPFLTYEGRAAFVLARTSNPGGADFQNCDCGGEPLFLRVARQVTARVGKVPGTAGLVAGATDIAALARLRDACPEAPFLIPGVGAQGGEPGAVLDAAGSGPIIVNSSRSVLYASGGEDFAEAAAREAERLRRLLGFG